MSQSLSQLRRALPEMLAHPKIRNLDLSILTINGLIRQKMLSSFLLSLYQNARVYELLTPIFEYLFKFATFLDVF